MMEYALVALRWLIAVVGAFATYLLVFDGLKRLWRWRGWVDDGVIWAVWATVSSILVFHALVPVTVEVTVA